ncbi:MAG: sialidase family protein, partial [Gammaproteobacteria bacterium]|nr:sialidase family protein [Gammaproteobacteria bacterium]
MRSRVIGIGVAASALLGGCDAGHERAGDAVAATADTQQTVQLAVGEPVRIGTGVSPLDGDCGKLSDGYTYPDDTETDPRIAISPTDPARIAVAFMRDPVLAISAATSEDGGATWHEAEPPGLSPCTGTSYNSYGDQDLAAGIDDRLYLVSVQGDFTPEGQPLVLGEEFWMNSAVTVSTSTDFGRTWSQPRIVSPLGEY